MSFALWFVIMTLVFQFNKGDESDKMISLEVDHRITALAIFTNKQHHLYVHLDLSIHKRLLAPAFE